MPKTRASLRFTHMPIRSATRPPILARLEDAANEEAVDIDAARFLGPAALAIGAFDVGNDLLAAAVDGLRTQGRLGLMPRLLFLHACVAARIGDWETAITAADEARRLAEEFADPQAAAPANTAYSLVAAMRGDEETAEMMAARAEAVAEPVGANITMAFAQFGKVLGGARRRPPRRRVCIGEPPIRAGRLGLPPVHLLVADRGPRRGGAPHRRARGGARTGGAGRGARR